MRHAVFGRSPRAEDRDKPRKDVPAPAFAMGGYQQLVRGEPFRGKFRHSFEKPEPFTPGKVEEINATFQDVNHTFRRGHRIMVQVQSSWFPLTDRNPQKFMDIPKALASDFVKKRYADLGASVWPTSPQEAAAYRDREEKRLMPIMKAAGIKPE